MDSATCRYSIIICTRNRAEVLKRALTLHARLSSGYGVEHEYVIVDNGSTDHTRNVVDEFSKSVSSHVAYEHVGQPGHSIALNRGCRLARGERLVFTDDDTLPASTWFPSIHNAFSEMDADWVFGPVKPLWEFGPRPIWYGPQTSMFVACLDYGNEILVSQQLPGTFVGANHACLRQRIFELGLYDEKLGIRGDGLSYAGNDDNLFAKAQTRGFKIVYHPHAVVEHLIAEKRYLSETHRATFRMTGKNMFLNMVHEPGQATWFGVPRYQYRFLLQHVLRCMLAKLMLDSPRAFYHETQAIRFATLIRTAISDRRCAK